MAVSEVYRADTRHIGGSTPDLRPAKRFLRTAGGLIHRWHYSGGVTGRRIKFLLCVVGSLALVTLTFAHVGESGSPARQSSLPAGPSIGMPATALDATGILDSSRDLGRSLPLDQLMLAVLAVVLLAPKIGAGLLSRSSWLGLAPGRRHGPVRLRGPPSVGGELRTS